MAEYLLLVVLIRLATVVLNDSSHAAVNHTLLHTRQTLLSHELSVSTVHLNRIRIIGVREVNVESLSIWNKPFDVVGAQTRRYECSQV
jgi:hypothetical protein